jgi:hypothetical protein
MRPEDRALLRIAATTHHVVGLAEVAAAGLTARQWQWRVNGGEWVEVASGQWRHAATPDTFDIRVRAGSRALGRDAALAGAAAAAWWGLDGFPPDPSSVIFAVPRHRRRQHSVPVHSTRDWRQGDLLWRDGIRITSVTRVVLDLAEFGESARRIEAAIDSGIRMRLTSVPTLRRRIGQAGGRGRRGIPLLRELMLDSGGESALERRFLRLMREHGLPSPQSQVTYAREAGRAMRVDFEFRNGLVVEVSGRLGHTSDRDRQREGRRRNALQQQGSPFREFTTADVVDDPGYVVSTIRAALR